MFAFATPAVAGVPEEVAALRADHPAQAAWVARGWLADDPADAARWVLLADARAPEADAEGLYREALRLDPGAAAAWVGLGRLLADLGRGEEAGEALARGVAAAPDLPAPAVALAAWHADPAEARAVRARFPSDPGAALLVARLDPAGADDALAGIAGEDAALARASTALARGDAAAAEAEGPALAPLDAARLGRWVACLRAGTADGAAFSRAEALRRAALLRPLAPPDAEPLRAAAPRCAAAAALAATVLQATDPRGAAAALADARALGDDPALRLAHAEASLLAGAPGAARRALAGADPLADARTALALGRALVAERAFLEARAHLAAASARFPDSADLVLLRADVAPTPAAALAALLPAVAATHDPRVERLARAVAAELHREPDLLAALAEPPAPVRVPRAPLGPGVAEEIVVVAERPSEARLRELVERMLAVGYGAPERLPDGALRFAGDPVRPAIELRPEGQVFVDGVVQTPRLLELLSATPSPQGAPGGVVSIPLAGLLGLVAEALRDRSDDPQLPGGRGASREVQAEVATLLMTQLQEPLDAWKLALCKERKEEWSATEVPVRLAATWREGVPLRSAEGPLETPAERRGEILDFWATRACTPQGDAMREATARFLREEVQTSAWPVRPDELAVVRARSLCPVALVL